MSEFVDWLDGRLRDLGWSYRELARRAGVSPSGVSVVVREQGNPGAEFCLRVSVALNEAPTKVFRIAGLLPRGLAPEGQAEELLDYFEQMTPASREHFMLIAQVFARRRDGNGDAGGVRRGRETPKGGQDG